MSKQYGIKRNGQWFGVDQSALGELAHRLQSEGPLVLPTSEVCAICGHEVCTTDIPHPRTLCESGSGPET